ncbi:MAG: LacI family DNA-binding transcriptional regulator [Candidatus Aminicenantes bacterium]|nr:LacI family DNA-binding transcriptional regulator [Candidatus Aminicenantes bacterium]
MSTIKEIARRANVSIGTVDRVIHGRGRVAAKTEKRIRRIVEEIGYKPNIFAKQLRLGRTFMFGVVMPKPAQDSRFWALPEAGAIRAARELTQQRVKVRFFHYDKFSAASLFRVQRKLTRTGLDGLLVAPVLSRVFEDFFAALPPDLPYVLFDSFIPKANHVSCIGQDAYQSGVLSARLMRLLAPAPGPLAVLRVLPEDYHIDERVRGFIDSSRPAAANHPVEVFEVDPHAGAAARDRIFSRVVGVDGLNGVFVANSSTHQIAAYLQSRPLRRRIRVVGYDLVSENVRLLRAGAIDFLISQRPERQGYLGVMTLFRHVVLNEPVDRTIMMPIDIIARENLEHYRD